MPLARTISALVRGVVLSLLTTGLALLPSCNRKRGAPTPASVTAASSAEAAQEAARRARAAQLIAAELSAIHEQKLKIVPPREPIAQLAFGKDWLAVAASDKVIFRNVASGEPVFEADTGAVQAVVEGAGGELVALGEKSSFWLLPSDPKPKPFSRVVFFPRSQLQPDREDPLHFYLFDSADAELAHYSMTETSGPFLLAETYYPFDDYLGALGLLRDGAFVYATVGGGLTRNAPRGRKTDFKLPPGTSEPWRLLPGKRLDDVFSVGRAGQVVQFRLEAGLPALLRFHLPEPPVEAAAGPDALAFVLASAPRAGAARHWSLLVTDLAGQTRFRVDLPAPHEEPDEGWMARLVKDKSLAISSFQPLVAVGGPHGVSVWNYESQALVFTR